VASVKAPVDHGLDAAASRLEGGGDCQGGAGHHPTRRLLSDPAEHLPEHQHRASVDGAEQGGEQPEDQGAVDEPVDVVQVVAQDRDPDRRRDQPHGEHREEQPHRARQPLPQAEEIKERPRPDGQQRGIGEPLQLLTLLPA
jgi:hypothetical protein